MTKIKKVKKSNYVEADMSAFEALLDSNSKSVVTKDKKIYFAGPWFSEKSLKFYKTCQKIYNKYKAYSQYDIYYPKNAHFDKSVDTFNSNVNEINDCDIFVASIDDKDVGTAWEIGIAYVLGKKIFLLGLDETSFETRTNLMLAFTGKCITLNNYHKLLLNTLEEKDIVNISTKWENIE